MCIGVFSARWLVIAVISGFIARCFSLSVCHHRRPNLRHPRPKIIERRIMEAIIEPIYSHQLNDPGKLCSMIEIEKKKQPEDEEALIQVEVWTFLASVLYYWITTDGLFCYHSCTGPDTVWPFSLSHWLEYFQWYDSLDVPLGRCTIESCTVTNIHPHPSPWTSVGSVPNHPHPNLHPSLHT